MPRKKMFSEYITHRRETEEKVGNVTSGEAKIMTPYVRRMKDLDGFYLIDALMLRLRRGMLNALLTRTER
jgi:hypothetical protein